MKIACRTNLDLLGEDWPTELPAVPRIGEKIQSKTKRGSFQLYLEVYNVTSKHIFNPILHEKEWIPVVELYIPKHKKWSPVQFYKWYASLTGTSVSYFISE